MNRKIKVAFIYKKSNIFLTGKHFDNGYYHFFIESLSHDPRLDVSYFPAEDKFNTSVLNDKFDIILLFGNHEWEIPNELEGINDLGIPVIARAGEPHRAYKEGINVLHKKYNIDHYFGFFHEASFHKFYPLNWIIYFWLPKIPLKSLSLTAQRKGLLNPFPRRRQCLNVPSINEDGEIIIRLKKRNKKTYD